MKNVKAGKMQRVLEVDTDVLYQWRDLVPTYQIALHSSTDFIWIV